MSKADTNQSRKELTGHLVDLLRHAERLDKRGHTDSALDLVFDQIDEMLLAGDFSRVDRRSLQERGELQSGLLVGLD